MRWLPAVLTTLTLLSACEAPQLTAPDAAYTPYPGSAQFADWSGADDGCGNKRAEILRTSSTVPVTYDREGSRCTVDTGRWLDPYTGRTYTDNDDIDIDIDIDHVIPKKWAWEHGAWRWSPEMRSRFANDNQNLLAVEDSANQSKGDRGPDEWMPPQTSYGCEYIRLFVTLADKYGLQMAAAEAREYDRIEEESCRDSDRLG
ncbi:HNH endonuclease family protein [Poseidonocella sp. HB161398]|uniref:HNH endonuclease family protein n=1 Tax=Poseidonocella sp. HB161398 TaxID=2320855 RepID=UPI001108B093|nr:HNH endonuclease family protein [Poseidonocella sp. HB161398]